MKILLIILCIILWIICGAFSIVFVNIPYMRRKSFDQEYMEVGWLFCIACFLAGPAMLLVVLLNYFLDKKNSTWLTQIIWKIANLGVEKGKEGKEND